MNFNEYNDNDEEVYLLNKANPTNANENLIVKSNKINPNNILVNSPIIWIKSIGLYRQATENLFNIMKPKNKRGNKLN